MSDNEDQYLDRLLAAARATPADSSRLEFGFETRLTARLREENRNSLAAWAWKLCPFFAAVAVAVSWWSYSSIRAQADPRAVVEATSAQDDGLLIAYMTGEDR